jgi:hypothetical protein
MEHSLWGEARSRKQHQPGRHRRVMKFIDCVYAPRHKTAGFVERQTVAA